MSMRSTTWRLRNIPSEYKANDVRKLFHTEDRAKITIRYLVPDADDGTLQVVIFLFEADRETRPRLDPDHSQGLPLLKCDNRFIGFTPLNIPKTDVSADIIAITGLGGHAFGSWAKNDHNMWLMDDLPTAINNKARILIYGYNSQTLGDADSLPDHFITDHSTSFKQSLLALRKQANVRDRPLILIGHSLGGLIVKYFFSTLEAELRARIQIRGLIFIGCPHHGMNQTALAALVGNDPPRDIVTELAIGSTTLELLHLLFSERDHKGTTIISFFEELSTREIIKGEDGKFIRGGGRQKVVTKRSAQIGCEDETLISVDGDHSTIAKVDKDDSKLYDVLVASLNNDMLKDASELFTVENSTTSGDDPREVLIAQSEEPLVDTTETQDPHGGSKRDSQAGSESDPPAEKAVQSAAAAINQISAHHEKDDEPDNTEDGEPDDREDGELDGATGKDKPSNTAGENPVPQQPPRNVAIPTIPLPNGSPAATAPQTREIVVQLPPWMDSRPVCSVCSQRIARGRWWRCKVCPSFHMDERCFLGMYSTSTHSPNHQCTAWDDFMLLPPTRFVPIPAYFRPDGPIDRLTNNLWSLRLGGNPTQGLALFGIDGVPPGRYGISFSILYQAVAKIDPSASLGTCTLIIGRPRNLKTFLESQPNSTPQTLEDVAQSFSSFSTVSWKVATPASAEQRSWMGTYRPTLDSINVEADGLIVAAWHWQGAQPASGEFPITATLLAHRWERRWSQLQTTPISARELVQAVNGQPRPDPMAMMMDMMSGFRHF